MSTEPLDPTPDSLTGALGVQGDGEPKTTPPNGEPPAGEELDENGEPKKKMGGFQKRIQKLTTRLAVQEEEIARLRAGSSAAPAQEAPALTEPQPPDESKFSSYAEFKAAELKFFADLAEYKAEMKIQARDKAKATEAEAAKAREKQTEVQATWSKRLEAAHEAHPDLEDLLEEDLPTTPTMQEFLMASAHGGEMLHHLASHPAECRRIAGLTPRGAEIALARIEDEISAKTPSTTTQKRTTSAPAPLQPLKGTGTVSRDPSKLSDAEWLRQERAAKR